MLNLAPRLFSYKKTSGANLARDCPGFIRLALQPIRRTRPRCPWKTAGSRQVKQFQAQNPRLPDGPLEKGLWQNLALVAEPLLFEL